MAARTTILAVKGLLMKDYDALLKPSITPFIDTATILVDRLVVAAARKGVTLSSAEQEIIERWLAAHAYVCSDQTFASKATEGASGTHHGQTGMALDSSRYGQMAMTLDPSGALAAMSKRIRASGEWLGRPPSEQTDYIDRD